MWEGGNRIEKDSTGIVFCQILNEISKAKIGCITATFPTVIYVLRAVALERSLD